MRYVCIADHIGKDAEWIRVGDEVETDLDLRPDFWAKQAEEKTLEVATPRKKKAD